MARLETTELLERFADALATRYQIDPTIRYFRDVEQIELDAETRYYLEPGSTLLERINVASPRVIQTARLLTELVATYDELDAAIQANVNRLVGIGRDLMRTPNFINGAFLTRVQTFRDAPSAYSVEGAEERLTVYGGIEFEFAIE